MIREIIIPTESQYILQLPESLIGKKVEVLAFEIAGAEIESVVDSEDNRLMKIKAVYDGKREDLSNYKFNRDEANNYEE